MNYVCVMQIRTVVISCSVHIAACVLEIDCCES